VKRVFTYFIHSAPMKEWKIGRTTDLVRRMGDLLPHCQGQLVAMFRSEDWTEGAAHEEFDDLRVRGEWFSDDPRIAEQLAARSEQNLITAPVGSHEDIVNLWRGIAPGAIAKTEPIPQRVTPMAWTLRLLGDVNEPHEMVLTNGKQDIHLVVRTADPYNFDAGIQFPALGETIRVQRVTPILITPFLTVQELAQKLAPRFKSNPPHWTTLMQWMRDGHIPVIKIGAGIFRFNEEAVVRALKKAKRRKAIAKMEEERS
jgi:hypothetical protein